MATTYEKTWQFLTNHQMDTASATLNWKNMIWWAKAFLKGDVVYSTTIAAGSNGASLPQGTINVASTSGFPTSGTISVTAGTSMQDVAYTGITGTTFTGCTGGTGTLSTGGIVLFEYSQLSGAEVSTYQGLWTTYYSCDGTTAGTAGDGYDRWGSQGGATGNSGSAASFTTGATIPGAVRMSGLSGMSQADVGNCLTISGAATAANNSPTLTPFKIVSFVSSSSVDVYNPSGLTTDANNGSIVWTERYPSIAASTTIAAGSNGASLPQSTINVASTTAFPSSGVFFIVTSSAVVQAVSYTGTSGGNQFTGCSGGTGSMTTGGAVTTYGITNNTAGNAHSWQVLKSPSALGPYYIIFDVNTSGILNLSVSFSKTAPTGGSTTARPTAVDEVQLTQWNNTAQFSNGATVAGRMHGGLTTDGNFHLMTSFDGNGGFWATIIFQVLADTKSQDLYTGHLYYRGNNNTPTFASVNNNSGFFGGRSRNGAVSLLTNGTYWMYTNGQAIFNQFLVTTDAADGAYDDMPIYIYTQTVGYKGLRGRWYDYRWCPNNIPNGTVESSQTSPTATINGNLWIPYNAVPIV